jgi:hypothetical protein
MKKLFLSISIFTILFVGCGGDPKPNTYVSPELKGAPSWVLMPVVKGFVAEVGSAPSNSAGDISFQREEAMADARDNLARQISVKVNNLFKSFKASTGSKADATFDKSASKTSKQIASQTLVGSQVRDTWISSTGVLYVLMVVENRNITNALGKGIKTSFRNERAMYQKFLEQNAMGELDKELEKIEK